MKKLETPSWYQMPMRISALQCNFEKDTMTVVDKWADMGFNVEQLFHPIADLYSALYDPGKHEKLLRKYIEKSHQKGIRIILYLNIHILGPAIRKHEKEWSLRNPDGSIIYLYEGTYPSICPNSPWRAHFSETLNQVKTLPIDGLFLDGPFVGEKGCYCGYCTEMYKNKFGLKRTDLEKNWEFTNWTSENLLTEAHRVWHKDNPDRPMYHNLPIHYAARSHARIPEALAYNDIVGSEGGFMHYGPAKEAFLFKPSLTAKLLEAVAPEKPRVIFMAGDHKPWSWWPHTPVETELCVAASSANGANVWYGIHGSTAMLDSAGGRAARHIFRFLKKNESAFPGTYSAARVGLVYSFESDRFHSGARDQSDFLTEKSRETPLKGDMELSIRGYYEMLVQSRIPFDLISDHAPAALSVTRYDAVILPSCGALSPDMTDALENYVNTGGTLIAQADASLYNRKGIRKDFALSGLFGVSFKGSYLKHTNWNYARILEPALRKALGYDLIPLPLLTLDIYPVGNPVVHAEALHDMPGRYTLLQGPSHPLVVENRSGKGRCIYIAAAFGEMFCQYRPAEYRLLLEHFLRKTLPSGFVFENAPSLLEVAVRRQGADTLLHLVNYSTGPLRPFTSVAAARDITIRLPKGLKPRSIRSLALNKTLHYNKTNNSAELPELGIYDILRIKL